MTNKIAITFTDNMAPQATLLANETNIPLISKAGEPSSYDFLLVITPEFVGLSTPKCPQKQPFYLDFTDKKLLYRIKHVSLRKELLAKALGTSPKEHPIIIDATAGLGRDSFILAALGYTPILFERSQILFILLRDAMQRGSKIPEIANILQKMSLNFEDSCKWMKVHSKQADIVYLDPMFPQRKKSASVKKEMLILQNLLEKSDNEQELLHNALACACKRVVVKRPRLAPPLAEKKPHFSLAGTTSRFDVYLLT
jgi:16S rRNA (guanine1516-N2)-methyltransferase